MAQKRKEARRRTGEGTMAASAVDQTRQRLDGLQESRVHRHRFAAAGERGDTVEVKMEGQWQQRGGERQLNAVAESWRRRNPRGLC